MGRRFPKIGIRIAGAFAIVLGFALASLVVTVRTLEQIAEAEDEVERLDRAKHAGHHVASMAREMYIHQAHTVVTFGFTHLDHYQEWVEETREATRRLVVLAPTPEDKKRAKQIGVEADQIHLEFERLIIPAIERDDRAAIVELHDRIDAIRERVVDSNRALAADFERRSEFARVRAKESRLRARYWMVGCTALAALAAAFVGLMLLRSVLNPISVLRDGAMRIASGDLTHRIAWHTADEFGELAETFNKMTAELARHREEELDAQRLQLLGQVTAGVAHELNNPLGVVLGYLRLIEKDGVASPDRLATIREEALQCQRIVSDLLEVVRPEHLDPSNIDIARIATESAARIRDATHHPDLTIRADTSVETWGDASKLRQVLDNLVRNGVEACPAGSVVVEVYGKGAAATIRVQDYGPGIPTTVGDRVFDPFFTTKAEGTGLGLAISRAIIEAHGGRISLQNVPVGTCFVVSLPRRQPAFEEGAA